MCKTDKISGGSKAAALREMTRANEQLKGVRTMSRQVKLGAINARLLARQAGTASQGYRVAAAELGEFSRSLDQLLAGMEGTIFDAVKHTADLQNLQHRYQLFAKTSRTANSEHIRNCIASAQGRAAHCDEAIQERLFLLLNQLIRAEQLAMTGRTVARLARLEAVQGATLAPAMTHAVAEIEATVVRIVDITRELSGKLSNY
jgi:hypothetical protein